MSIRNKLYPSPWQKQANKLELLHNFSAPTSAPRYSVGDRCRWIPMPETEWGTVIGLVYMPDYLSQQPICSWGWVYLLLLDADSPSQGWVDTDWVAEEDMELLPSPPSSINSSEEEVT